MSAATCALPPQQALAAARARMPGSKAMEFPIAKYPPLGTVTIEAFIRAREIWVNPGFDFRSGDMLLPASVTPSARPTLTAIYGHEEFPGLFLQGDGRDVSLNFPPEKTRAFAVLDFAAGTGYFIVNKSVSKLRTPLPISSGTYTAHKSWDARPTYRQWGGANNWFYADWISGDVYRFRTHIKESAFGTSWFAPGIDVQVSVNKDTGQATVSGDTFPTVAVHQPSACRTLFVRPENKPADLYVYEAPGDIAPGPQNATPVTTQPPPAGGVNRPPTAAYSYARRAGAGNIVAFDGRSSTDSDGRITSWQWLTGTQQIATGPTPTVALGTGTSKTVTLRVTDNRGATASMTRTLALGNRAPVIAAVSPTSGSVTGANVPTLAAIARDDDGDALQYAYRVTGPSVDVSSGWVNGQWTVPPHRLDPGTAYQWSVTVRDPSGATVTKTATFTVATLPTAGDVVSTSTGSGYWQADTYGGVFSYGDAPFHGSLPGLGVRVSNILGMARTPTNGGYWLVGRDGGVFAFGDAPFVGSLPGLGIHIDNIVGMAPAKDGKGYWLVGSDGGVFAFGTARFHGSMGGKPLNAPVEAIAPTPSGNGYWLVARDGGVFAFGDAPFYGSMGGKHLNAPVVDMDAAPDGRGYWLTAEDGGVFAYGSAGFHGSLADKRLNGHITAMSATPDGHGYWLNACDGGVFAFGNAVFHGSRPTYQCRGT
ncbi:PKD domain-containing protein [Streptomyces sp. NPDC049099]|uniref:PKD domain-containing protein n=1 Tax=Streptomyces sp. NPDC049099 TaxID=3155768 RepID=UPI003429EE10